jgi:predicted nucleic acid-binding protein
MGQYLIDNNIISHYFSESFSENAMIFISEVIDNIPNISVITEIEALSWINPNKSKEKIIKEFISDANVIFIDSKIVSECVKIRRSKKIKTPDAIIAATAITNQFTLITTDNDFKGIAKLKIINPNNI